MKILKSVIKTMRVGNLVIVIITLVIATVLAVWLTLFGGAMGAAAQTPPPPTESTVAQLDQQQVTPTGKAPLAAWGLGLLSAALATGLSAVAAGIAVGLVGSAAMGAVAEKPEVMGRSIIFVGLAEGIAIYGLIISIMILGKL